MYTRPEYIYHNEKSKLFYGRYNATENDIVFLLTQDSEAQIPHDRIFYPSASSKVSPKSSSLKTTETDKQDASITESQNNENTNNAVGDVSNPKTSDTSQLLSHPTNSRIKYEITL
jgi:hypothetical protein